MNESEKRPEDSLANEAGTPVEPAVSEMNAAPAAEAAPAAPAAPEAAAVSDMPAEAPTEELVQKKRPVWVYVAAFGIVVITLLAVLFILEKEGRSSTGLFDAYFAHQSATAIVATVNGEEINGSDLSASIEQFTQVAFAQGVDVSNPDIQDEIRQQSLDVLVNTELLRQEAEERGLSVEMSEAEERLATIEADLGGPEALQARIKELGMSEDGLVEDIRDEILIQKLLDGVFAETEVTVTDEEIEAVYTQAGGEAAGLPPLAEVRAEVIAQIQATKEQQIIEGFLMDLRNEATIETF